MQTVSFCCYSENGAALNNNKTCIEFRGVTYKMFQRNHEWRQARLVTGG